MVNNVSNLQVPPFPGLVWFGLVWFGLVWFGLVWFGLVWFGLVWFGLVWFGMLLLTSMAVDKMWYLIVILNFDAH
jgi:hypothetical protein